VLFKLYIFIVPIFGLEMRRMVWHSRIMGPKKQFDFELTIYIA
jgi:hypothetical protein